MIIRINFIEIGAKKGERQPSRRPVSWSQDPNPVSREASPGRGSTHGIPVRMSEPSVDSTNRRLMISAL